VGYTELLLGRFDHAEEQLSRTTIHDPNDRDWETAKRHRAQYILEILRTDPVIARAELDSWADQSATALGLIRTAGGFAEL